MSMGRADAVTFLSNKYGRYVAAVGMAATDTDDDLKEPIDEALRALAVAEGDLATAVVADADMPAFRALLKVKGLEQIASAAGALFDVGVRGDSFRLSQLRAAIDKDLIRALSDPLAKRHLAVGFAVGSIDFDFTEPDQDVA